jgi:putative protein-disulfide isomerase
VRGSRDDVHFTFLIDPLCGWCYGAMPHLNELRAEIGEEKIDVMPTGLFAGNGARPMTSQFRGYAWANDQRIAEMTGQIFSQAYYDNVLSNESAAFDSGPASLVLALADLIAPGTGFDLLNALQQARFVAGRDLTDRQTLTEIAVSAGLPAATLAAAFQDARRMEEAVDRITTGRRHLSRHSLEGVPALLWQREDESGTVPNPLFFSDDNALIAHCKTLIGSAQG